MSKEDPTAARRRKGSLLLSGLLLTPDQGLEAFRERRGGARIDVLHLRRSRDILEALVGAILEDAHWDRVEGAWELLCRDELPAAAVPAPPAPAAPMPAAPRPTPPTPTPPTPAAPLPAAPLPARPGPAPPVPAVVVISAQREPTGAIPAVSVDFAGVPFKAGPDAPPPSVARDVAAEALALVGQTATTTPALSDDEVGALPFRAAVTEPALTLEQYASLRAELAASPDREARAAVLGRYGVLDSQLDDLARSWVVRLRDQPELYRRFHRAYDEYLAWLAAKGIDPRTRG